MSDKVESCGCNKKKMIENFRGGDNIEHFSFEAPKNMCHYACSSMNVTNIMLFFLILILIYLISKENFNIFKKN
jgi:hypothetical protein